VALGNLLGREEQTGAATEFFETMSEGIRTGKAALAELQAKRFTLSTSTAN